MQNNDRIKANVSWNNTLSLLMLHSSLFTAVILVVTLAHTAGAIFLFFLFSGPYDGTVGHMTGLEPGQG